jgi:hypothetical protein
MTSLDEIGCFCFKPPFKTISKFFDFFIHRHWVANTCSTSLVPIPKARDPNAPWVDVWLSPQTIVLPGSVNPNSGPITWTIPWYLSWISKSLIPNSLQLFSNVFICNDEIWSTMGKDLFVVGTLWSTVAKVRSGLLTLLLLILRPSKAWGEVTSCT